MSQDSSTSTSNASGNDQLSANPLFRDIKYCSMKERIAILKLRHDNDHYFNKDLETIENTEEQKSFDVFIKPTKKVTATALQKFLSRDQRG